jgi:hypothetical protein
MSAAKRQLITCVFCGNESVPSSGEDVFPLWLVNKLAFIASQLHPEHPPEYIEHAYATADDFTADVKSGTPGARAIGEQHRGSKPVGDKLPEVCETCNNGWMSRLEQIAKLNLEGFIFGREKTIDPYDKFVIATWITKTCLAYDASFNDRWIRSEIGTRPFYETGYPLYGVHAMIGHDPNHFPEGARLHVRSRGGGVWSDGSNFDVVRFAFQFDHLIIRAVVNCFDNDAVNRGVDGLGLPKDSPYFVEVWPQLGRTRWPSENARVKRTQRESSVIAEPPDMKDT